MTVSIAVLARMYAHLPPKTTWPVAVAVLSISPVSTLDAQNLTVESLTDYFSQANIVDGPTLVDCTLSAGTKSTCFQITVKNGPSSHALGPWCPETTTDTAEAGGIWLENGEVYNVDGAFIKNLSTFYEDEHWQLFDSSTGDINVTDTYEKCAGAAKPDVEPEFQQHCVQCLNDYMDDDASVTYTIPMPPVVMDAPSPTTAAGSGVAFNGLRLDAPAPVSDILGNYTLAPFDDCGGHINLHVGYHYHAATDCLEETAVATEHGRAIGLAMDGHWIMERESDDGSVPSDLDRCGGHVTNESGYHYHAGEPGSNAILGCLVAQYGCVSEEPGSECDASASRGGPGGSGGPDFAAAARTLGVSESALMDALGGPPPDLDRAASQLGLSVDELQKALARH
ncbi:MAG: YHYH protein [Gammaproteobacteria bacterium]|nr:YHYH protein [Gammaproteobacteria bacterium]